MKIKIDIEALLEGITPSEISTHDNCPTRWYLSYNQLLKPVGPEGFATLYGSAMHGAQESFYGSKGSTWIWDMPLSNDPMLPASYLEEYHFWNALGKGQMAAYAIHYKHDFKVWKPLVIEHNIEQTYEGWELRGKVDMVVESKDTGLLWVWDTKTSTRLDPNTELNFSIRFQFMYYLFCMMRDKRFKGKKFGGFIPNVIKKPQIKKAQNEANEGFAQRVKQDMISRPEMYFYRKEHTVSKAQMKHWETHFLLPKLQRLQSIEDAATKGDDNLLMALAGQKNTDACVKFGAKYACPFLQYCTHGEPHELKAFEKKPSKHTELNDNED